MLLSVNPLGSLAIAVSDGRVLKRSELPNKNKIQIQEKTNTNTNTSTKNTKKSRTRTSALAAQAVTTRQALALQHAAPEYCNNHDN